MTNEQILKIFKDYKDIQKLAIKKAKMIARVNYHSKSFIKKMPKKYNEYKISFENNKVFVSWDIHICEWNIEQIVYPLEYLWRNDYVKLEKATIAEKKRIYEENEVKRKAETKKIREENEIKEYRGLVGNMENKQILKEAIDKTIENLNCRIYYGRNGFKRMIFDMLESGEYEAIALEDIPKGGVGKVLITKKNP